MGTIITHTVTFARLFEIQKFQIALNSRAFQFQMRRFMEFCVFSSVALPGITVTARTYSCGDFLKCRGGSWLWTEAGGVFVSIRLFSAAFIFRIWLSPRFYIAVSTSYKAYSRCGRRLYIYRNYEFLLSGLYVHFCIPLDEWLKFLGERRLSGLKNIFPQIDNISSKN